MGKSSVSDLSEHVFDLIQELFAIDPLLLTSVMPQLEFKLKVRLHQHSIYLMVHLIWMVTHSESYSNLHYVRFPISNL